LGSNWSAKAQSSGVQSFEPVGLNTSMPPQFTPEQIIDRLASRLGLRPGWIDEARRAATPYVIEWPGLSREDLGDAEFQKKLWEARHWCNKQCPNDHEIEPMRDKGRLIGRQFRFASDIDAVLFKRSYL
jgi:hypothetical protein